MALDLAGEACDGQMLMAYSGLPDMQRAGLPIEKYYEQRLGPGDRTQVLMHVSNARLPSVLQLLFVYTIKAKYNIMKIKMLKPKRVKFE